MDDDLDGVLNAYDQCWGYDDNLDLNQDGVPDGCENEAGWEVVAELPFLVDQGVFTADQQLIFRIPNRTGYWSLGVGGRVAVQIDDEPYPMGIMSRSDTRACHSDNNLYAVRLRSEPLKVWDAPPGETGRCTAMSPGTDYSAAYVDAYGTRLWNVASSTLWGDLSGEYLAAIDGTVALEASLYRPTFTLVKLVDDDNDGIVERGEYLAGAADDVFGGLALSWTDVVGTLLVARPGGVDRLDLATMTRTTFWQGVDMRPSAPFGALTDGIAAAPGVVLLADPNTGHTLVLGNRTAQGGAADAWDLGPAAVDCDSQQPVNFSEPGWSCVAELPFFKGYPFSFSIDEVTGDVAYSWDSGVTGGTMRVQPGEAPEVQVAGLWGPQVTPWWSESWLAVSHYWRLGRPAVYAPAGAGLLEPWWTQDVDAWVEAADIVEDNVALGQRRIVFPDLYGTAVWSVSTVVPESGFSPPWNLGQDAQWSIAAGEYRTMLWNGDVQADFPPGGPPVPPPNWQLTDWQAGRGLQIVDPGPNEEVLYLTARDELRRNDFQGNDTVVLEVGRMVDHRRKDHLGATPDGNFLAIGTDDGHVLLLGRCAEGPDLDLDGVNDLCEAWAP